MPSKVIKVEVLPSFKDTRGVLHTASLEENTDIMPFFVGCSCGWQSRMYQEDAARQSFEMHKQANRRGM